jgi:hypothetical protein
MKFYVTTESIQKIKRSFLNLKLFSIIYVPEILEKFGYSYETIDEYGAFIVSNKINDLITSYAKSKRIRGIIYSNPSLNEDLIPNLFETLKDLETITDIVLLENFHLPKLKHLYPNFDEIIFFPSIKKIRLIEATNISELSNGKIDPRKGKE